MKTYKNYVNNEWVGSADTRELVNPANGQPLAVVPVASRQDVERAIAVARATFDNTDWHDSSKAQMRGRILFKMAALVRKHLAALAELETMNCGKPIVESEFDITDTATCFEYNGGLATKYHGETINVPDNALNFTLKEAVGVCGLIVPWNYPLLLTAWKLAPALAAGCTVVIKPATQTPLTLLAFCKLVQKEIPELPPGVLNVVTGPGSSVGNEIVENPRVRHVSFTGGVPTGIDVYARAAKLLKSIELELGGKNPVIVMDDANVDLALEGVIFGAFGTAGQRCTATSRLIVHEAVYDEVVGKLVDRTRALKVGNGMDPKVDVGPVVSKEQERAILDYVRIGLEEGAKLLVGGEKLTGGAYDRGFFLEPTVFEARHGMRVTKEEIFGPVLSVMKVPSYEAAVKVANDVEYGLSSSIYTRNVNLAFRAIEDLDVGITYINAPTIGAEVHLPFGGTKHTGNGGREAGSTAINEFTEIKAVFVDYSDRLQKAQIDRE